MKILKLQFALFWYFLRNWHLPYAVSIQKRHCEGIPPFWAYVYESAKRRTALGAVQGWSLPDILEMARKQYLTEQQEQVPVKSSMSAEGHACRRELVQPDQLSYRWICSCGWKSRESDAGHPTCLVECCPPCSDLAREMEEHVGTGGVNAR
jgi:hypothetical protein